MPGRAASAAASSMEFAEALACCDIGGTLIIYPSRVKSRQRAESWIGDRHRFEQFAHGVASAAGEAHQRGVDVGGLHRRCRLERRRPRVDAEATQEFALDDGP